MKNYIDFSMDVLSKGVQKSFIQQGYKENIVFQWLKRPCLMYCRDSKVLSQENLFYICFQLLDTLKQCDDLTDCQVQSEMQCIPYEVERIFDQSRYAGNTYQCMSDRLLVILTLYRLLCMIDCLMDQLQVGVLAKYLLNDTNHIIPKGVSTQWYKERGNGIIAALTQDSPIYKRSSAIISADYCEADEPNLMDYIQSYMVSPQKISKEIAAHKENSPTEDYPTTQTIIQTQESNKELEQLRAQIKTLEESLQKKDEEIAVLREEIETFSNKPTEGYIQIESKCKTKVAAILSAMFYAHYFHGVGDISDRNEVVTHILKYGFNYPTKSVSQLLWQYTYNKGNIENLKDELRSIIEMQLEDTLKDLVQIQKDRSNEK